MPKLSALRKACGLTQQQLADLLGVNRTVVTNWETGVSNIPAKYLLAMAEALGCSVEDILNPA